MTLLLFSLLPVDMYCSRSIDPYCAKAPKTDASNVLLLVLAGVSCLKVNFFCRHMLLSLHFSIICCSVDIA